MTIYNTIADSVNLIHLVGFTIITSFPLIAYLDSVQPISKHLNKFTFVKLSMLNTFVLITYYFKNDICIITEFEHYFNPIKYPIYTVSPTTKNTVALSIICTVIPAFIENRKYKFIFFGAYYSFIIYSLVTI
jgi:hypothetical protein